ncbi:MAG: metal ABC transporter permease [Ndongobacter sp.]|nr:metal ABC transporter permease [Ndongobacter sp.]
MIHALIVLLLTSLACSLLGVFLTLRRLSMLVDAISHTVLLGIVLAFFATHDLTSPWLLIGAAILGVITVALIESLGKTGAVKYDDAIGVVFPMLFALAVILISRYARNVHLDTDMVLSGEVLYSGLNTFVFFGIPIAHAALRMGALLLLDLAFILLFYKELKVSTFDTEFAALLGLPLGALFYALMTLTSLTAVAAFDAVGSVLVLSFFITPAASALLWTKDLRTTLLLSALFAVAGSFIGYRLALFFNVSISGMCAVCNMGLFTLSLLLYKNGPVATIVRRRRHTAALRRELFLIHLGNHAATTRYSEENALSTIHEHLHWSPALVRKTANRLKQRNELAEQNGYYVLTPHGESVVLELCYQYGLTLCPLPPVEMRRPQ